MPARRDDDVERKPVTCKRCNHFNDPYPDTGRCTECSAWLPGNQYVLKSEDMKGIAKRRSLRDEEILKRAKKYITDAGENWEETSAVLQDLCIRYATTKERKDGEIMLQQLKMLQAKPKSSEEVIETSFSIEISAKNIGELQKSLEVLDAISRN